LFQVGGTDRLSQNQLSGTKHFAPRIHPRPWNKSAEMAAAHTLKPLAINIPLFQQYAHPAQPKTRFDSRVTSDLSVGCDTKGGTSTWRPECPACERTRSGVCAVHTSFIIIFSPFLSIRDGGAAGTKAPAPATRRRWGRSDCALVSPLGAQDVCKHQHFRPRIRPCGGGRSHTLVRRSPIINPLTG
jgi:hypothetical protein